MRGITFIYCLCEPGTKVIRYIGKTDGRLKDRLRRHLLNYGERDYRANWIEGLKRCGQTPDIHLLCTVPREDFVRFERAFIAVGRKHGLQLTNLTDGGEGPSGNVPSAETRAKLSAVWKGRKHSVETRLKMSAASKGRSKSPEQCAKMSLANKGKTVPLETRQKISDSLRGEKNHNFKKPLHPKVLAGVRKKRAGAGSKFFGVSWCKAAKKWKVQLSAGNGYSRLRFYLGCFSSELDAARVYDAGVKQHNISAELNFPDGRTHV